MRSSVLLDTNGWIILLNSTEQLHSAAQDIWHDLARRDYRFVVTDWIIAETGNGLARTRHKSHFSEVVRQMLQSPNVEIVDVDRELLDEALSIFEGHSDKAWGLVDCASFVVMRQRGIVDAFTSDHDFEQAGFQCLLTA